jgi:hypothetical protein
MFSKIQVMMKWREQLYTMQMCEKGRREFQQELQKPLLENVNRGAAFSEDNLGCNCISEKITVDTVLHIVATFHSANETGICINSVFTV